MALTTSSITSASSLPLVSIIIPVYNAEATLNKCLLSILNQDYAGNIEICIFNDNSTDTTEHIVWQFLYHELGFLPNHSTSTSSTISASISSQTIDQATLDSYCTITHSGSLYVFPSTNFTRRTQGNGTITVLYQHGKQLGTTHAHGPAFGRNRAVSFSHGEYLCLLDADDQMLPSRITWQYEESQTPITDEEYKRLTLNIPSESNDTLSSSSILPQLKPYILVGGYFTRDPPDSMKFYTEWANTFLNENDIYINSWRECSMIQPTWFMHRQVFESIGGYDEIVPKYLMDQYTKKSRTGGIYATDLSNYTVRKRNKIEEDKDTNTIISSTDTSSITNTISNVITPVSFTDHTDYPIENMVCTSKLLWTELSSLIPNTIEKNNSLSFFPYTTLSPSISSSSSLSSILTIHRGVCPWTTHDQLYRHPPLLSRAPVKLHPLYIKEHSFRHYSFGEDPLFWHRHLCRGGLLRIVRKPIAIYHYSPTSLSMFTPQPTLLRVRTALFEERCLGSCYIRIIQQPTVSSTAITLSSSSTDKLNTSIIKEYLLPPAWKTFSIWNAGRDGKLFYNSLSPLGQQQIVQFLDIDPQKIGYYYPQILGQSRKMKKPKESRKIPTVSNILHPEQAISSNLICTDTSGEFTLKRNHHDIVTKINDNPLIYSSSEPVSHPIVHLQEGIPPIVCCVTFKSGGTDLITNITNVCQRTGAILGESLLFIT